MELLSKNIEKTKNLLAEFIPSISVKRTRCNCGNALKNAVL
jgi:hypothetical protein